MSRGPVARGWRRLWLALACALAAWGAAAQTATPAAAAPAASRSCPPAAPTLGQADLPGLMAQARDRGLLWRVERNGVVSHLYGSLHLGRPEWAWPGPRLAAALRGSKLLALELDITDPATQQALVQGPPEGLPAVNLSDDQRQRLTRQIERACLPPQSMGLLHPMLQVSALSAQAGRWDGLFLQFGSELLLTQLARAGKLSLQALESPFDQLRALLPADGQATRRFEQGLRDLEDDRARPMLRRLAAAWEAGRLDELADYAQWCDCVRDDADLALMRRVLDGRNQAMATRIDELARGGQPFLAAVGALHMVGPKALPQLLRERGFSVERVMY